MKLLLVCALMVAVASAALPLRQYPTKPPLRPPPSPLPSKPVTTLPPGNQIPILRLDSDIAPDGSSYQYTYETGNGISAHETGNLIPGLKEPALAAVGFYKYTSPEGLPVHIDYIADENGFQASGDVLPTPPPEQPIPPAILRSLEYIAAHPQPLAPVLTAKKYY